MKSKLNLKKFQTICLKFDEKVSKLNEDELNQRTEILCGVENFLYRKNRAKYLELFKAFLQNEIGSEQFSFAFIRYFGEVKRERDEFVRLLKMKIEKSEEVELEFKEIMDCRENEDYKRMSSLLGNLFVLCDLLTFDEELYDSLPNYYVNDKSFQKEARSIITQLLFYLKFL